MLIPAIKKFVACALLLGVCTCAQAEDLLQIYQLALENDPTLKQAYNTQNAALELDDQSRARLLPTVSMSLSSSRDYLSNSRETFQELGTQYFWNHSLRVNLNQPLIHYDYWVQLQQAENQTALAIAQYELEQQNTAYKVIEAYFKVLAAQDALQFTQSEKKAITRQLEQAQHKFKLGLGSVIDIHEAQAVLDSTIADEIAAEARVNDEHQGLLEIIGTRDVRLKSLSKQPALAKPEPVAINVWEKAADSNNLNIISASNQTEIARKQIDIQQSGHLPQLDLSASYAKQDTNSSFGLRGDTGDIGLQLNIPLYAGGAVNSKVRQATYEFEAAKDKLSATRRNINKQVNNAYRGVITSISRANALSTTIKSAENALHATEAGFRVGTRTVVEVLLGERNLHKAKREHAQALYDYLLNRIRLKYAISDIKKQDLEQINTLLLN